MLDMSGSEKCLNKYSDIYNTINTFHNFPFKQRSHSNNDRNALDFDGEINAALILKQ